MARPLTIKRQRPVDPALTVAGRAKWLAVGRVAGSVLEPYVCILVSEIGARMIQSHIVPKLLLKRFADERGDLRAFKRTDLGAAHPEKWWKACREGDYYQIKAEALEEWAREGHNPNIAEEALGRVETEAGVLIADIIAGKLPRTDSDRLHLALFVALQMTRGWQFHEEVNQSGTLQIRQELQDRREEARIWLRHRGQPAGPKDVKAFLDLVSSSNGPHLVMNKATRVQVSLRHALYRLTPMLLERHLRILRFDKPSLVVSDAPVGNWAPGQDRAVGIGNAALVFLPLSRQVALAYGAKASAVDAAASPRRAAQINFLAADGAVRWIYEHPDDRIVETLDIPTDRPKWVTEFVAELDQFSESPRELWQHVRR